MRNLRNLLLLAITAIAALALSASSASAQEDVEVSNEATGAHCSSFTMVGHDPVGATCTVRAVSESPSELYRHTVAGEALFSLCDNVFEAAFNEQGEGFIYNQELTPEGDVCGREPCDEAAPSHENLAWPAHLQEVGDELQLEVTFCLYAHNVGPEGTTGLPCHVILHVNEDDLTHDFEVTTTNEVTGEHQRPCTNLGGAVSLEGHWLWAPNEAHPNAIEIDHL